MIKLNSILFVLFFILIKSIQAQWVQNTGPYGCSVSSLNAVSNQLFLTTGNKNYISKSNGSNWETLDSSVVGRINSVVEIGTNLFAGTDNGIFQSIDGGVNWESVSSGLPGLPVNALLLRDSTILAGIGYGGGGGLTGYIFASADSGKTWTQLYSGKSVNSIMAVGKTLFVGTGDMMYGAGINAGGLFISNDNGVSWSNTNLPSGMCPKNSILFDGINLFVRLISYSTEHGYNFRSFLSADSGKIWAQHNSDKIPSAVGSNGNGGINVYGVADGVFLSNNHGADWINIGLKNVSVKSLVVNGTNLFAGTDEGIFLTTDFGSTWTTVNPQINNLNIRNIAADSSNLVAVSTEHIIYTSNDGGLNWIRTIPNVGSSFINHLAYDGTDLYASTVDGALFITGDNGINWREIFGNQSESAKGDTSISSFTVSNKYLFASVEYYLPNNTYNYKLLKSENNGLTWMLTGLPNKRINRLGYSKNSLYGVLDDKSVFLSTDDGESWLNLEYPEQYFSVINLALSGSNLIASTYGSGVYIANMNESVWTSTDLKGISYYRITISDNDIFAGGIGNGVFHSIDNGYNWIEINNGLANLKVNDLTVSGSYLFVGTDASGIWKRPLSEVTSIEKNSNYLSPKFSLDQNYPNPFNPTTTIKYSISQDCLVKLKIYDLLGNEITTLVDNNKSPGNYSVKFYGSSFASGVYFYVLYAGDYIETKKLVLLK